METTQDIAVTPTANSLNVLDEVSVGQVLSE
jgi:hypothetical protein